MCIMQSVLGMCRFSGESETVRFLLKKQFIHCKLVNRRIVKFSDCMNICDCTIHFSSPRPTKHTHIPYIDPSPSRWAFTVHTLENVSYPTCRKVPYGSMVRSWHFLLQGVIRTTGLKALFSLTLCMYCRKPGYLKLIFWWSICFLSVSCTIYVGKQCVSLYHKSYTKCLASFTWHSSCIVVGLKSQYWSL